MRTVLAVVVAVVAFSARPAVAAEPVAEPAARQAVSVAQLERQATRLRWELHELNYSDIATDEDRWAKQLELAKVRQTIRLALAEVSAPAPSTLIAGALARDAAARVGGLLALALAPVE